MFGGILMLVRIRQRVRDCLLLAGETNRNLLSSSRSATKQGAVIESFSSAETEKPSTTVAGKFGIKPICLESELSGPKTSRSDLGHEELRTVSARAQGQGTLCTSGAVRCSVVNRWEEASTASLLLLKDPRVDTTQV